MVVVILFQASLVDVRVSVAHAVVLVVMAVLDVLMLVRVVGMTVRNSVVSVLVGMRRVRARGRHRS